MECLALFWRLSEEFFKVKEGEVYWSLGSMGRLIKLIGYKSVFRMLSKGFGLDERICVFTYQPTSLLLKWRE